MGYFRTWHLMGFPAAGLYRGIRGPRGQRALYDPTRSPGGTPLAPLGDLPTLTQAGISEKCPVTPICYTLTVQTVDLVYCDINFGFALDRKWVFIVNGPSRRAETPVCASPLCLQVSEPYHSHWAMTYYRYLSVKNPRGNLYSFVR